MSFSFRVLPIFLIIASTAACSGGGDDNASQGACSAAKISGGESCSDGQPNVAYILTSGPSGGFECTGSYISLTAVLTAAHCFAPDTTEATIASRGAVRRGTEFTVHPLYDGSVDSPYDIAVLKVDVPLNNAPLPLLFSREPQLGEELVAYGYGEDQNGLGAVGRIESGESPLKAAFITYIGNDFGSIAITSAGDGSVCPGDSGGPVLAKDGSGRYGIIGITRAGVGICDADADVPAFLSSTQTSAAIQFLNEVAPDAAVN